MDPVNPNKENQNPTTSESETEANATTPPSASQEPIVQPTQTPTPTPTPPPAVVKPPIIPTSPLINPNASLSGRSRGFRNFVILAIVILVIIYGVVAYLYLQNRNLKQNGKAEDQVSQAQVTPTPEFSPDQIKIQNGTVVREKPGADPQILINKDDYESTGITGFAKVTVAPDNKNICFESWPPAPEPALYVSKLDGSEVAEVSPNRQGCIWASDGSKIYYINTAASSSPVNIYSYVLSSKSEENLTIDTVAEGVVRRFGIVGLSADSSKLICKYEDVAPTPKPTFTAEPGNQCEIDLQTNEITLL